MLVTLCRIDLFYTEDFNIVDDTGKVYTLKELNQLKDCTITWYYPEEGDNDGR